MTTIFVLLLLYMAVGLTVSTYATVREKKCSWPEAWKENLKILMELPIPSRVLMAAYILFLWPVLLYDILDSDGPSQGPGQVA